MTLMELSGILKDMYENAPECEGTTVIHLFGIKYAKEIKDTCFAPKDILKCAGLPASFQSELSNGIRLAKFVRLK